MSGGVDFGCICWQLSWFLQCRGFSLQNSPSDKQVHVYRIKSFKSKSKLIPHPQAQHFFMSLALYLKIRNLFGIGASLCFALFYVQTLPILTNFYIHAKHKHTLPSCKFIVHQYWIRKKKLEQYVCDSQYTQPISNETQSPRLFIFYVVSKIRRQSARACS